MTKIAENLHQGFETQNSNYDRATELIFKDILNNILEYGVRTYIQYGIEFQYYSSIEDGITALYRKSRFYDWLIDRELYESADLIKNQINQIEYEENNQ